MIRWRTTLHCVALLASGSLAASASELQKLTPPTQMAILGGLAEICLSSDGRFVYTAAAAASAIGVFARDASTGALAPSSAVEDGVGDVDGIAGVRAIALSPDESWLYAAAMDEDAISVFARDSGTGALTLHQVLRDGVDGVDGLAGASDVAVSPDGRNVYVAARRDYAFSAFAVDDETGTLSFVNLAAQGFLPIFDFVAIRVAVSGDGSSVYGARVAGIVELARDAGTGALTLRAGTPFPDADMFGISNVQLSPDLAHFYVSADLAAAVTTFEIGDAGALTFVESIPDDPAPSQAMPYAIAFHPTRDRAYVPTRAPVTMATLRRDPSTGRLTPIESWFEPLPLGAESLSKPTDAALSPDGAHVYVADEDGLVHRFATPEPGATALGGFALAALHRVRERRENGAASRQRDR